ncbi:hypothetical protein PTTG_07240 [Puccinia triticina 1-1 BBBD Race 1]|uniref:Uncharacterized protein n=2 Tax=Puccinia triticina TaxID=208348 RepID=A0A180GL92_PUCT1|nr:uncharacterized protein PtA15_17A54 [Puccinia triticina]OAV93122.1 hypothetical protein PTTG_07240 [Puccinia triticina 1-1 BBBD Race 1]WAQ92573.1 hypothetical protein PtA15_17A54 [Puccinia triticina]WAR63459.1 hypothetical protein PtB15_17B59 [Puccinia triticina]
MTIDLPITPDSVPDGPSLISHLNDPEISEQRKQDVLQQLASWLKTEEEGGILPEDRLTFLDELSLDLPSIILHRVGSKKTAQSLPPSATRLASPDATILNSLVRHGSPKEVFMALTTTILQFLTESPLDLAPPSPSEDHHVHDSLPNPPRNLDDGTFLRFILSPLSTVILKILTKSRNPRAFYDPFCQCLLGLLDRCGGRGESQQQQEDDDDEGVGRSVKTYQEIVDVCQKAVALHADLESKAILLLASSAALIFASPSNEFPLGKAFLCHRDPKWRASFSRLLRAESAPKDSRVGHLFSAETDPVQVIQAIIAPILGALAPRQIKEKIIQISGPLVAGSEDNHLLASLDELGYGTLSGHQLVRLTRQGALVIQAFDRFSKIGADKEPTQTNKEEVEGLIAPSFVEAGLFLLLSERSEGLRLSEELGSKLIGLASSDATGSNRLLIFRSLAYMVHDLDPPPTRLEFLAALIGRHPSQPNIKSALVSLLRETLAHLARAGLLDPGERDRKREPIASILPPLILSLIHSTPFDLNHVDQALLSGNEDDWSTVDELLKYVVERLNLVYLLLKTDTHNLTGIRTGELNARIKQLLISPVHGWMADRTGGQDASAPAIKTDRRLAGLLFSVTVSLELCVDLLNQI